MYTGLIVLAGDELQIPKDENMAFNKGRDKADSPRRVGDEVHGA